LLHGNQKFRDFLESIKRIFMIDTAPLGFRHSFHVKLELAAKCSTIQRLGVSLEKERKKIEY
jgi:hypothetical protein